MRYRITIEAIDKDDDIEATFTCANESFSTALEEALIAAYPCVANIAAQIAVAVHGLDCEGHIYSTMPEMQQFTEAAEKLSDAWETIK